VTSVIDKVMDTTFAGFIRRRRKAKPKPQLHEVTELFPRDEINAVFRREIQQQLGKPTLSPESREDLTRLLAFDFVGYMDRSLRRAGFRDPDLDPMVQDLVVKLVVTGTLFSGWTGGSLKARFLVALKNAIATLVVKRHRHRRRSQELPTDAPSRGQQESDSLVEEFRDYLRSELGPAAVSVFDQRLAGQETKDLIGQQGLETGYRLKQLVAQIKDAARRFASGNSDFHSMVQRAFEREAQTMDKRFRRNG
jgi:hypothetical protein